MAAREAPGRTAGRREHRSGNQQETVRNHCATLPNSGWNAAASATGRMSTHGNPLERWAGGVISARSLWLILVTAPRATMTLRAGTSAPAADLGTFPPRLADIMAPTADSAARMRATHGATRGAIWDATWNHSPARTADL